MKARRDTGKKNMTFDEYRVPNGADKFIGESMEMHAYF